jgi:hypothetical protein
MEKNTPENSHAKPESIVARGFRMALDAALAGTIHFNTTSTATPITIVTHHGALNSVSMGASLVLRRRAMICI